MTIKAAKQTLNSVLLKRLDDLHKQLEQLTGEKAFWTQEAERAARNIDYYRGLLLQIGQLLGPEAAQADDGGYHEHCLPAKLPSLVEKLIEENARMAVTLHLALQDLREHDCEYHYQTRWPLLTDCREGIDRIQNKANLTMLNQLSADIDFLEGLKERDAALHQVQDLIGRYKKHVCRS